MANEEVIAKRYAKGLAEYANAESRMDEARRDVRALADVLDPRSGAFYVPEFHDFLSSPVVTPADKLAASERIMEQIGIGAAVSDFMKVLLKHNRVDLLPRIAREFADISGRMTGEHTALVRTARPLSEEQAERLSRALSEAFGGRVRLHQQVDPGLLAGAKVTVGDKTFDGSVLGRLDSLKHRLVHSGEIDIEELELEEAPEGG